MFHGFTVEKLPQLDLVHGESYIAGEYGAVPGKISRVY